MVASRPQALDLPPNGSQNGPMPAREHRRPIVYPPDVHDATGSLHLRDHLTEVMDKCRRRQLVRSEEAAVVPPRGLGMVRAEVDVSMLGEKLDHVQPIIHSTGRVKGRPILDGAVNRLSVGNDVLHASVMLRLTIAPPAILVQPHPIHTYRTEREREY